jgi:uncharacterized membrane protein YdbT with pleckstrin-like domain
VAPQSAEQVFFHGHPSWRSMLAFHIKGVLLSVLIGAIAGLLSALVSGRVQAIWVVAGVLAVFVAVLGTGLMRRMQTTYTITDQRLTIQLGLLTRELHEARLERVQNVRLRQSLLERAIGVGTVYFDTAASAAFDFSFAGIANPRQIVRTVDAALRDRLPPGAS